jgi:hypothetical protein
MDTYSGGGAAGIAVVVPILVAVFFIAVGWKIFTKAGKPGWAVIIPIYNIIVMLEIVNRPIWWIILMLIPVVNFIVAIILALDLATSFGKGTGFAVGLILLGIIFYPILAFGDAQYQRIER